MFDQAGDVACCPIGDFCRGVIDNSNTGNAAGNLGGNVGGGSGERPGSGTYRGWDMKNACAWAWASMLGCYLMI